MIRPVQSPPPVIRSRIGDIELVAILDGVVVNAPHEAAPGVDVGMLRREYPSMFAADGAWQGPVTSYLLRIADGWMLLDSGIGPRRWSGWPRGALDAGLAEARISPGEITAVVMSHLHDDHVGWNTVPGESGEPRIYFENAAYYTTPAEWDHWMAPELADRDDHAYLRDCVAPLRDADLRLVEHGHELAPGISLHPLPGHTPGHSGVRIVSAGQVATLLGDATHYLAQLDHPEWSPLWDLDPALAAETRRRVFEEAADDPAQLLLVGHWAYPGIGRLRRENGRLRFEPVA